MSNWSVVCHRKSDTVIGEVAQKWGCNPIHWRNQKQAVVDMQVFKGDEEFQSLPFELLHWMLGKFCVVLSKDLKFSVY